MKWVSILCLGEIFQVQTLLTVNSFDVLNELVIAEQILLPCECLLMWSSYETRMVLCQLHSREYMDWKGNDDEFIRLLTSEHSYQMRKLDKAEIAKMR
jgi:hypothetical protein